MQKERTTAALAQFAFAVQQESMFIHEKGFLNLYSYQESRLRNFVKAKSYQLVNFARKHPRMRRLLHAVGIDKVYKGVLKKLSLWFNR